MQYTVSNKRQQSQLNMTLTIEMLSIQSLSNDMQMLTTLFIYIENKHHIGKT